MAMSTTKRRPTRASAQIIEMPRHSVPVIDRMMHLLDMLERRDDGVTISELARELDQSRTTIYRILNTLQAHEMVERDAAGAYRLGRRILSLAAHVRTTKVGVNLVELAQPMLDRFAVETGNSVKLSVLDSDGLLVVAAAQGRRAYALSVVAGQRMPPHASAAGKLLLAHLSPERLSEHLARTLAPMTARSITDPNRLRLELRRIRKQGWAQDRGESAPSIYAFAAPVLVAGKVAAALSIPFLMGTEPSQVEDIRSGATTIARLITEALQARGE